VESKEKLHMWAPDSCCSKRLSKALGSGKLDGVTSWECPKCRETWRSVEAESAFVWTCHPMVAIIRPRR
jgi:hypothetical protein